MSESSDVAARARAWGNGSRAAVCDVLTPWAHGTIAFADEALAGLAHRRIDCDLVSVGAAVRADFEAQGWKALRLVWMRHEPGGR